LDDYFFEGPYIQGTPQNALPTTEYEQWQYDQKFTTPLPSRKAVFTPIKGTTPVTALPPLPSTAPTPISERSSSLPGLTEDLAPELSPLTTQKTSKGKFKAPEEQEEEIFNDGKEEPIPEPSFEFLKQPEYQPRNPTTAEGPSSEQQPGSPIQVDPPEQKKPLKHAPPTGFPVTYISSFLRQPPLPKAPHTSTSMTTSTSDKFKFPEPREFDGKKRNAETWILRLE
jgi:hypothetical protein